MIQLFKHVLECGTNSKQWNRFQKMNHVLDNGTCPRERNLFQRMKHAQENGTYSINGTFSREWNMFKRMEQHVPENGTCSREWNMFKRMEHVPGKLVDVQTWSWFIAAVDLSQQVLSGSQMFQLSNKQTKEIHFTILALFP